MIYAIAFILLLGILVFAHEFGHFIVGKLSGVRVDVFSIGFGKPLLAKKIGDTEYRISMIPLGGYVKFYGEDEKEERVDPIIKEVAFSTQKLHKRVLIVSAGPVFNFFLAVFLFACVYFIGEPNIAPVLGYVEYESIAWDYGLRVGDEVTHVNGISINTWREMDKEISTKKSEVVLTIKRTGRTKKIIVPLKEALARTKFGEIIYKPQILGIAPNKRSTLIGVSSDSSPAFKAGFRTGDLIISANDKKIKSWTELEDYLLSKTGVIKFKVRRDKEETQLSLNNPAGRKRYSKKIYELDGDIRIVDRYYSVASSLGFYSSELFISDFVDEESPALAAGLKKGDRIVAINGKIIRGFRALQHSVDRAGKTGQELNLTIERNGKLVSARVSPKLHDIEKKELGQKEKRFLLGVQTYFYPGPAKEKKIIIRNPFNLIWASILKTLTWIWITLIGIFKLITGSISLKAIGGPVMIGKVAGESLSMGIVYFFRMMAIISINLGIINLFPIPVLDGGHLMFYTYEAIAGQPLKERYVEIAQQIGFYILIGLILMAFYNDILKYGSSLLGIFG